MPDGPFATPDEERMLQMIRESGSPEEAGRSLFARLAELETLVEEIETAAAASPGEPAETPAPAEPEP